MTTKAKRRASMGTDPLDLVVGHSKQKASPAANRQQTDKEAAAVPRSQPQRIPKERATFHVSSALFDQIKDAVVALSGPPLRLTLADFAEAAFRRELDRIQKAHHDGKPFPKRSAPLRTGRPIGS